MDGDGDDGGGAESVGGVGRGFAEKFTAVAVVVVVGDDEEEYDEVGMGDGGTKEGRACWRMLADTMLL